MIRAVFFDFYGTLADWPDRETVQRSAAAAEGVALDPAAIGRAYIAANAYMDAENAAAPVQARPPKEQNAFYAEYERRLLAEAGAPDVSLDMAARIWRRVRREGSELVLFPDAAETLEELQGMGLALGVVSNIGDGLDANLDRLGVGHLLPTRATPLSAGVGKPFPAIFHHALAQAKAAPSEAVHIGDSAYADAQGARNAGIAPVLVVRGDPGPAPPPADVPVVASLREAAACVRAMAEAG